MKADEDSAAENDTSGNASDSDKESDSGSCTKHAKKKSKVKQFITNS